MKTPSYLSKNGKTSERGFSKDNSIPHPVFLAVFERMEINRYELNGSSPCVGSSSSNITVIHLKTLVIHISRTSFVCNRYNLLIVVCVYAKNKIILPGSRTNCTPIAKRLSSLIFRYSTFLLDTCDSAKSAST